MTEPKSRSTDTLLDHLIPPVVLGLGSDVGFWALARAEMVPLAPATASWVGLGAGLLLGLLLDRILARKKEAPHERGH